MLCEYVMPVSHESWLSAEERRRMSERNRGAAADRKKPVPEPVQPAAETAEAVAEDDGFADEIVETLERQVASEPTAEERRAAEKEREHAAMLERMRQSELNRLRAVFGHDAVLPEHDSEAAESEADAQETEQSEPEAFENYEDEYDVGRTHAAAVARRSLRSDPAYRRGWYLSFPSIIGTSAMQLDYAAEQAQTSAEPEIGYWKQEEAEPEQAPVLDMASRASSGRSSGSRKVVSGGRYSDYGRSGGYQRRITTGGAVIIGLLTVLLIGCVIYGKVQTNEIYTTIAELQAEYDDITAQNISMKSEMEGKMTVKNIEEYAENVLGLRQLDQSQIEYIQIQTEDEVVITEPEQNLIVTINDYLTSFWEFLRGA